MKHIRPRIPFLSSTTRCFFFLLVLSVVTLPAGWSQVGQPSTPSDTTLTQAQQPIPVIEVVEAIGAAQEDLKQIRERAIPKRSVARIDSLIPVYSALIQDKRELVDLILEATPNRQELENLIYSWNGYREFFQPFLSSINFYASRNSILLESITSREKTWELTYQNAVEKQAPAQVLINAKAIWDAYRDVQADVVAENGNYLRLQSEINEQLIYIEGVLEELKELKYSEAYQLLHLRDVPLWQAFWDEEPAESLNTQGRESFSESLKAIWTWIKTKEHTLYLYLILIVLILFGLRSLRSGILKYDLASAHSLLPKTKGILLGQLPWTALFMAFIFALLLFVNSPLFFEDVVVFLLLVCSTILTRPHILPRFRFIPYFIILIFLMELVKIYIPFSSLNYRLYLLGQTLVFAALLLYFSYPYSKFSKLQLNRFGTFIQKAIPLFYILVGIALIAILLGYTNLAEVTVKIMAQGSALTLLFYAILLIVLALFLGALHRYFSSRMSRHDINRKSLEGKIIRFIRLGVLFFWIFYFLQLADLYQPLTEILSSYLSEPYKVGGVTFTLGMISDFILILAVSFLIASFISFLLDGKEVNLNFLKLPRGIPAAVSLVIRYFILAFGFFLALSSLGIDLSKFNLLAGALGLGIGFGLQTVVSNFISGIILVFERPILTGDVVEVNNLLGIVTNIGVRSSRISTYDGAEVVVPNNTLISKDLINWTLSNNIRRNEVFVSTAYGTDLNRVLEILNEVVAENKQVLTNPPPLILFEKFGDSSLEFRVLFWVYFNNSLKSKSDVSVAIYNRFKEEGIQIPFPQLDVHFDKDKDA